MTCACTGKYVHHAASRVIIIEQVSLHGVKAPADQSETDGWAPYWKQCYKHRCMYEYRVLRYAYVLTGCISYLAVPRPGLSAGLPGLLLENAPALSSPRQPSYYTTVNPMPDTLHSLLNATIRPLHHHGSHCLDKDLGFSAQFGLQHAGSP